MQTNDSLPVQIKASRNGFTLVPNPEASFESILGYVEKRLKESREFFQHSEMTLDLRGKPLGTDQILQLHNLLVEKASVKVSEIRLGDTLSFFLERGQVRPSVSPPSKPSVPDNAPLIVRNTCRSGARVVSPSDCVVLGDVNPGAEIIAAGDVIVFGNLRGIAHAGAGGNRSSRIWALSIEPSQIRIADLVAVPPVGASRSPNVSKSPRFRIT